MSSHSDGYRIIDEPQPGLMAHLTVNPFWCLFGVMFGGTWLSWPWFIFNGWAMGSPSRRQELLWAVLGLVCVSLAATGLVLALDRNDIAIETFRYCVVGVVGLKLVVSYRIMLLQSQTFELHEYYGGIVRNGALGVLAGYFLRSHVLPDVEGPVSLILVLVMA